DVVGHGNRAAKPGRERRLRSIAGLGGSTEARKGVDRGAETARRSTKLLASDENGIGRAARRRGDGMPLPALVGVSKPLIPPESRAEPAAAVSRDAADVFAREKQERGVGGAESLGAAGIHDRQPVPAIVGGELKTVRRRDHRGIAPRGNPVRRNMLPLSPQLGWAPVPPGASAVDRKAPPVADRPVP